MVGNFPKLFFAPFQNIVTKKYYIHLYSNCSQCEPLDSICFWHFLIRLLTEDWTKCGFSCRKLQILSTKSSLVCGICMFVNYTFQFINAKSYSCNPFLGINFLVNSVASMGWVLNLQYHMPYIFSFYLGVMNLRKPIKWD